LRSISQNSKSTARQIPEIRYIIGQGQLGDIAKRFNRLSGTADHRDRAVHVLLSDLVRQGEWRAALLIAQDLSDAGLSEDALLMASAQASAMGHAADIVAFAGKGQLKYTQSASIYAGVLLGTTAIKPAPPE
jgi:uncharacterized protein HemY